MELEERVSALEREIKLLKQDIQTTLQAIQQTLPEKPAPTGRWQQKAWVLALLNILLAVALFTNIYLYLPEGSPFNLSPTLAAWLRAFWIAAAFMWLMLQLYPLALLLEQDDRQWQGVVWRNARSYFRARPGLMVGLTLIVLLIAVVNSIFPEMWFVLALILLVVMALVGAQHIISLFKTQSHS